MSWMEDPSAKNPEIFARQLANRIKEMNQVKNENLRKEFAETPVDKQLQKDLEAVRRHEDKYGATPAIRKAMRINEELREQHEELLREKAEQKARAKQLQQLENSF